jgi:uncharacterized coiled-coil DUF342 family protein
LTTATSSAAILTTMSFNLSQLKEGLAKIKDLETALENSKWNQSSSPRAVAELQTKLLERYHQAKSLYLQRRLENIFVESIHTYDAEIDQFKLPDVPEGAADNDADENHGGLNAEHAEALANLETAVHSVHAKLSHMRNKYQAVRSRRQELEKMIQDLEEQEGDDDTVEIDASTDVPQDEAIAAEQEKIDELQEKKRELQAKLDSLRKDKEERMKRVSQYRGEVALLREEQEQMNLAGKDPTEFRKKIQELREIKEFYDSLREVMEELGGVKIEHVKEDNDNRHLHVTVLLYEEYKVEIEMEVYRKTFLKVVNAKWATDPIVTSSGMETNGLEQFSISMNPLNDLVQIAKTSMGPPHDVRFIIREACARIRITRDRVDDLALLRRMVLTKVVGNDQIACSLNEGIVIVMRLYDQWVRVEQIVGVNGWDEAMTRKIHALIPDKDESMKPSLVVEIVQKEIRRMQNEDGFVVPKTPVLPKRKEIDSGDMED